MNELLKFIESVDPLDLDALNEIDSRVWCFLHGGHIEKARGSGRRIIVTKNAAGNESVIDSWDINQYTRSRDALKSIRPEGWYISVTAYLEGGYCATLVNTKGFKTDYLCLPTEEIAELRAIIQAIEHERTEG